MPKNPEKRIFEVNIKFYKTFYVEVPKGILQEDVLDSAIVDSESRHSPCCEVELEHDETSALDKGPKTIQEIERLMKHGKVFTWDAAQHG